MSERTDDQIRDALARAAAHTPDPHPWSEIERRAGAPTAPGSTPAVRRPLVWLTAAACTIALVVALVAVSGADDEVRIDEPPLPTTAPPAPSPETTPAPATTDAPVTTDSPATSTVPPSASGWSGGLLDDLDTASLRPLGAFVEGDVIVPTAPRGWRVDDSGWSSDDPATAQWWVVVTQAPPDNGFGQVLNVRMSGEPRCDAASGCEPWGEAVTIDGVVWETLVVDGIAEDSEDFVANMTVRAAVGDRWVFVQASAAQLLAGPLLYDPAVLELLGGLRVGSESQLTAIGEACWRCDTAGAEGDPFAGAPALPPPTTASAPPGAMPGGADVGTGRPLTELAEGDVVLPTYVPPGLTLGPAREHDAGPGLAEFFLPLDAVDARPSIAVRLWRNGGPIGPVATEDPNHPHVEVAGLAWQWNDFESARIAHVGPFSVFVYLHGLDRWEAERFIEGLRAVRVDEFPDPIVVDGPDEVSVVNGPGETEVVASDDRFELTAVRSGDQVCIELRDTSVPPTMRFAANCVESTMLDRSTIVDFYPLDETDTEHVVVGVVDAPGATAVRVAAPGGEPVVTTTGPANQVVGGRFFLARLTFDVAGGIRLDRFSIEDASTDAEPPTT
jgi:hypothetical protein